MNEIIVWIRKRVQGKLSVFLLFLLSGIAIYGNTLNNPYQFDDGDSVVNNLHIRDLRNIPGFFADPSLGNKIPHYAGHYRPLVTTSYAIDYAMGGLNPVGYHLINLSFHVGSAFLVFLIVKDMLGGGAGDQKTEDRSQMTEVMGDGRIFASLTAGIIFLTHPFNAEAVNYITARSSVMSGFFYLLAFFCWVRYRSQESEVGSKMGFSNFLLLTSNFYLFSLLAFTAAMLCKEVVVTLPAVLWLYDLYFMERRLKPAATAGTAALHTPNSALPNLFRWRTYIPYLPFVFIVMIFYVGIRLISFGKVIDPFKRDILTQLLTELPVLVRHWQMFFFPRGFSLIHDVEIFRSVTWAVLSSGIVLFLYIVAAIYLGRLRQILWRMVSFFMLWFFIVLSPTTIMPLNVIFQENRGYLAMVSFAVLAGVMFGEISKRGYLRPAVGLLVVLLIMYSGITIYRNWVWGDDVRFWKDALKKSPRSPHAYAGLATAYQEMGDLFLSVETAKAGLTKVPYSYHLHATLGDSYKGLGDTDQAIQEYKMALRRDLEQTSLYKELALLFMQKGDMAHAEQYLREGIKIADDPALLYYHLGQVLKVQGKLAEGVEAFQQAVILYPLYLQARRELAEALEGLGRSGEARKQYQEILHRASALSDSTVLLYDQDQETVERFVNEAREQLANRSNERQ